MGLDSIKKKGEAMGKKGMAQILTVNKYEAPQMSLNLIAHICTATRSLDISPCFEKYHELVAQLEDEVKNYILKNDSFTFYLSSHAWNLERKLVDALFSSLNIVVAGGFSAGKSSLLNTLTQIGNLLPTGVEPVSVVNTFLNCRSDIQKLIIRGENLKKELVLLNEEVLACIQHSSKSKTYIAPVLNRIIIDTPVTPYLNGITFVDTPGYNNSQNLSESDRGKAMSALQECDAIFWCIDIENGTITKNDLDILKQFKEKPIVILFTKMDKKSVAEVKKIVEDTEEICKKELGCEYMPITVRAISCVNQTSYSSAHFTFQQIIEIIKSKCHAGNLLSHYKDKITNLFNEEIEASIKAINQYEEERLKQSKDKSEWNEIYQNNKEYSNTMKKQLHEVIIESYNEIMECADKRIECYSQALDGWADALNRESEWSRKAGFFSDTSNLSKRATRALDSYERLCNEDLDYKYWEEEFRQELYNDICEHYDNALEQMKNDKTEIENGYNENIRNKKKETELKKILINYKQQILQILEETYRIAEKQVNAYQNSLQKIEAPEKSDVFSAISGDNYERFLSCFSDGVDLSICNQEGYSPVTWAVRLGNNEMVRFFIKHNVNMSAKDKRGYNALETAVICHYQDICKMLLEADPSLINESQSLVELASTNHFINWVSNLK